MPGETLLSEPLTPLYAAATLDGGRLRRPASLAVTAIEDDLNPFDARQPTGQVLVERQIVPRQDDEQDGKTPG